MIGDVVATGRVTGRRLATILGDWRSNGSRRGASDLAAAIELQVLDGELPPGIRLPAERELTTALGVSRTLVGAALDRLRERGVVASRQGAGTWVTGRPARTMDLAEPGADDTHDSADVIDLARAAPAAGPGVVGAVEAALPRLATAIGGHGMSVPGVAELRERIAERYTARGLPTTPSQVLVTNGAQHAFSLALRALVGPGDRVLVEQPCYPNTPEAIRGVHAQPVPVTVDGDTGWDLAGIEAALRQAGPRLAYFTVDFQNPTGLRMSADDRHRLAQLLTRTRTIGVADETTADLFFDDDAVDQAPPPLAASAPEWVITVGSAAKSFWGGLRLGWVRACEELIERLIAVRHSMDLGSPILEQYVLAELLGDADALLRERRAELRGLRDVLAAEVRDRFPGWTFRLPSGGLSLWCRLPEPMSSRLAVSAAAQGVQLAPGSRFGVHGGLEHRLRLPFSLPAPVLAEAMRRLSKATTSCSDSVLPADASVPVT